MTDAIRVERTPQAVHVTFASPQTRNALSLIVLRKLAEVLDAAAASSERLLVLDHEGTVFCAGVDVKERPTTPTGPGDHSHLIAGLFETLWNFPKPVVVRVDGAVRGGGMGFIATADDVIATPNANFAYSEVKLGVVPAVVGVVSMGKLGPGMLGPWFLSGETFDGVEAHRLGLVTQIVEDDGRSAVADRIDAYRTAAPKAIATTKRITRRFVSWDMPKLLEEMRMLSSAVFDSPEAREGMAAFAEKRPPGWA